MQSGLRLALYQPDMAPNTGAMMRLCACFGVGLDIIEPCGFVLNDPRMRRAGMDYMEHVAYARHASWNDFTAQASGRRLVLLTTKAAMPYYDFKFRGDDILLVGQESAGVPDEIHSQVQARLVVPMQPGLRSLNVAMSAAIVLSEALRQSGGFYEPGSR
ncbi:MAG: tRNA (cytidine(34)-2'-O)-methyltransferase [Alphaproteobacteria bacterium]|nr:tRNA (cytidine(34)-2'-O)-methyltransferase [Alphaproteobacteria bacterium]